MPEYPDIVVYIERLRHYVSQRHLQAVRLAHPFLLRTVEPPIQAIEGRRLIALERLGKRIVFCFEGDLFLVLHLMISGRLRWRKVGAKLAGRSALAGLDFETGTLLITESATQKRASLHVVAGREMLQEFDQGGLEVLEASEAAFREVILAENHTLKRSLTDPRLISGIGNAYSDEILHRARLSPVKQTKYLAEDEVTRLYGAVRQVLTEWAERLRAEVGDGFPEKVTAFRAEMAVHGRFGEPCPVCGTSVQRIRYATRETNYCPQCQTGGKLLADRSLSRLLREDWPRSIEALEQRKRRR
jgi:formamidopyrimidine-DNA glycosylase